MNIVPRPVATVLVLVAVIAAACGSTVGSVAVSVGDVDYSQSDLRDDLAEEIEDGTAAVTDTTNWLNAWIFFTVIGLELESRGIAPTEAQYDQARLELSQQSPPFDPEAPGGDVRLEQAAIRVAAVDYIFTEFPDAPLPEVDPSEVPDMLCSNHILVDSEDEALSVLARLDAGEAFADLAMELSTDPGSGSLGGQLGCVVEGSFVAEFEEAGYAADDGEIVGPVMSPFGFHVIEVLSAGPATPEEHPNADQADLDAALAAVASSAIQEAQAEVDVQRQEWFDDVQESAIERYADSVSVASEYGTWDSEQFLLIAPQAGG